MNAVGEEGAAAGGACEAFQDASADRVASLEDAPTRTKCPVALLSTFAFRVRCLSCPHPSICSQLMSAVPVWCFFCVGFRKCWIFSFLCQSCGGRHSEIKPGGAFGLAGRRWFLNVSCLEEGFRRRHGWPAGVVAASASCRLSSGGRRPSDFSD